MFCSPQSMVLVLGEDRNAVRSSGDNIIKAISTRFAGGREVNLEPSRVRVFLLPALAFVYENQILSSLMCISFRM